MTETGTMTEAHYAFAVIAILLTFAALDVATNIGDVPIEADPATTQKKPPTAFSIATRQFYFLILGVLGRVAATFVLLVAVMLMAVFLLRKIVYVANGQRTDPDAYAQMWREYTSFSSRSGKFAGRVLAMAVLLAAMFSVYLFFEVLIATRRQRSLSSLGNAADSTTTTPTNNATIDAQDAELADILGADNKKTTGSDSGSPPEPAAAEPSTPSFSASMVETLRNRNKELFTSVLLGGIVMLIIAEVTRAAAPS
jgi:hypothetical protein